MTFAAGASGWVWWVPDEEPGPPEETPQAKLRAAAALVSLVGQLERPSTPACDPRLDPQCGVRGSPLGFEAASHARYYLRHRPFGYRDDCSGFVAAVFETTGVPMDGVVATLWERAEQLEALHWDPVPKVGDLVFFDDTWDRNEDGRWNDPLTHVGLVLDVEPDGTAVIAHSGTSRGRSTTRMNLLQPWERKGLDGREVNGVLRERSRWDPADAGYTTADLWAGFATIEWDQDWLTLP